MTHPAAGRRSGSVVMVTSERWVETSRLALAARNAGFEVHIVAPKRHPLAELDWIRVLESYSHLAPSRSVARALDSRPFDLVIPVDDDAAAAVFEAYLTGLLNPASVSAVKRSLGDPSTFPIRSSRAAVAEIAASEGVRAPRTWATPGEDSVAPILLESGLPAVLKSDGSSSGHGVMVADDAAGARHAYRALSRALLMPNAFGWLLPEYDQLRPSRSLRWSRPGVTIQEYVDGEPATMTAVAWEGEVIGSVAFRVVSTWPERGPATAVEPIQHPDMERAAEALARRLGLSGLFGIDFILSPDGDRASMLELNPRAVATAHLSLPWQPRPLFHLLADRLNLESPPPPAPLSADVVALFPQAWRPGASRVGVLYGDADVPDDADLVALCRARIVEGLPVTVAKRIRRIGMKPHANRLQLTVPAVKRFLSERR